MPTNINGQFKQGEKAIHHTRGQNEFISGLIKHGLSLVREFIEDATVQAGKVKVTERMLNLGRWIEKVQYYAVDEYYKN